MEIKSYSFFYNPREGICEPEEDGVFGEWVTMEDHLLIVNSLQQKIRELEDKLSFDIDDMK